MKKENIVRFYHLNFWLFIISWFFPLFWFRNIDNSDELWPYLLFQTFYLLFFVWIFVWSNNKIVHSSSFGFNLNKDLLNKTIPVLYSGIIWTFMLNFPFVNILIKISLKKFPFNDIYKISQLEYFIYSISIPILLCSIIIPIWFQKMILNYFKYFFLFYCFLALMPIVILLFFGTGEYFINTQYISLFASMWGKSMYFRHIKDPYDYLIYLSPYRIEIAPIFFSISHYFIIKKLVQDVNQDYKEDFYKFEIFNLSIWGKIRRNKESLIWGTIIITLFFLLKCAK